MRAVFYMDFGSYELLFVIGFFLSILLWILKFYAYKLFNISSQAEERLRGELLDNVFVLLLAFVITTSLPYISQLGLPAVNVEDNSISVDEYEVVSSLENVRDSISALLSSIEARAMRDSLLSGFSFNIMGLSFSLSDSRIADSFVLYKSTYLFLYDVKMMVEISLYAFNYMFLYSPLLILFGAVIRSYPFIKPFGGFLMALGISLFVYPIIFSFLFEMPSLPSFYGEISSKFCSIPGISPISFSGSGSIFSSTNIYGFNDLREFISNIYSNLLFRHLFSLAISLEILRVLSIVLSGQTLLSSFFERRIFGVV